MFDLQTAPKATVINLVRALQEDRGENINAYSTLDRLKTKELVRKVEELLSDGQFDVDDAGNVVRLTQEDLSPAVRSSEDPTKTVAEVAALTVTVPIAATIETKPAKTPKAKELKTNGSRLRINDDDIIEIVVPMHEARTGTKRAEWWGKLRGGIKVSTYAERVGGRAIARDVLTFLIRRGNVRLKVAE